MTIQVEQVGRQKTDDIESELAAVHVVATQLANVGDDQTLFQVRFTQHHLPSARSIGL